MQRHRCSIWLARLGESDRSKMTSASLTHLIALCWTYLEINCGVLTAASRCISNLHAVIAVIVHSNISPARCVGVMYQQTRCVDVMPRGTVTDEDGVCSTSSGECINVWNELSVGNVLDYFEKWRKEPGTQMLSRHVLPVSL